MNDADLVDPIENVDEMVVDCPVPWCDGLPGVACGSAGSVDVRRASDGTVVRVDVSQGGPFAGLVHYCRLVRARRRARRSR